MTPNQIEACAARCHEANRAYCQSLGDTSQPAWADAPVWQRESAIKGVEHALSGTRNPRDSHESWLRQKEADGWKYGPVKDAEKKEHPCFVPYDELPADQQFKDVLFLETVRSFVSGVASQQVAEVEAVLGDDTRESDGNGDELEKFLRSHAGAPLRVTVEPRTNLLRIVSIDQTEVLEGAVLGNVFQPKQ